jgi:tripartite ATP-independent transporter DctP family solute receptor
MRLYARSIAAVVALAVAVLGVPAAAAAADIVLKFGVLGATEYFYYKGAKRMADVTAERSKGRVEVQVFPNGQLGNERDMIEGMQLGTLDLGIINTPLLANFESRFMLFDMPFLFDDWAKVERVMKGPVGGELLKSLEAKGLKAFAFSTAGFRHVLNHRKPVRTPEDLKGLKIRTLDNQVHVAIMNAMGANATPMQYSEVFTALQQKTVDGVDFPLPAVITEKMYEVNKHVALTGHVFTGVVWMMSLKRFQAMPPDVQKLLEETATVGADHETELYNKAELEALETLQKKYGMVSSEVDKRLFRERMAPVYDRFQDRVGKALIESVRTAK